MAERRRFPRARKRFLLEFEAEGRRSHGFTHDLSARGIFIGSAHLPKPGTRVQIRLKVSDQRAVTIRAAVVRSYRVPAQLATFVRGGFCVRIVEAPEDYYQLIAALLRIAA
jgi:hypothetical protein